MSYNKKISDLDVGINFDLSKLESDCEYNTVDYESDNQEDDKQNHNSNNVVDKSLNMYLDYDKKGYIGFSCKIDQKYDTNIKKYKKKLSLKKGWNELTAWHIDNNDNALCLLTGIKNQIFVLDIDDVPSWNNLLNTLSKTEPNTVMATTGNGGKHLYFKYDDKLSKMKTSDRVITFNNKIYDIDIRNNGGMIIIPPSGYYNKNLKKHVEYKWINSILDYELLELPEWLYELLIKKENNVIKSAQCNDLDHILESLSSERHTNYNDWINVGMALYNIDKTNYKIWKTWSKKNSKYVKGECKQKWKTFDDNKAGLNIGSLIMWAQNDNCNFKINNHHVKNNSSELMIKINKYYMRENTGLRDLFCDLVKNDVVVTNNEGDGYIYDEISGLWLYKTRNFLREVVLSYLEPTIEKDIIIVEKQIKNVDKYEKNNYENILKIVKTKLKYIRNLNCAKNIFIGSIAILQNCDFIKLLNTKPNFLPIRNSAKINLKNGEITPRNKNDYFSFECDVEYVKERKHINKFMKCVFVNDDKIKYIQSIYGYCLTGETKERCLFIEFGKGSNGKSVLNIILSKILGINKFYVQAQRDLFVKNKKSYASASPHLYQLMNARVAVFSETEENDKLNDGDIKSITGNNYITCRALYGDNITFQPICKLILETNHLLEFNIEDKPIIDRLKYINFNQRFVNIPKHKNEHKRDPEFIESLYTDYLNECFSFFVDGAISWYKNGLHISEDVKTDTDNYINNMDTINLFCKKFIKPENGKKIKCGELYAKYKEYSESKDFIKKIKSSEFKKVLTNKFDYDIIMYDGREYYKNINYTQ